MTSASGRASTIELIAASKVSAIIENAFTLAGKLELYGRIYYVVPENVVERAKGALVDLDKALTGELEKAPDLTGPPG